MRPQFYNFIELFKSNITVDCISSDLEYWDQDVKSKEGALQYMKKENYDLLVIKKGENILKKVLSKKKKKTRDITNEEIISENLPITELLDKFMNKPIRHYFLKIEGEIKKIITIGDLQKGPGRLLLFGLIMNFEVVCIDYINEKCGSKWKEVLKDKAIQKIENRYNCLKAQDLDIDMLHCSFIEDKIQIIKKIRNFDDFCSSCEKDPGDVRFFLRKLRRLRNNLAHSNHMRFNFKDWDELLETLRICKVITGEMRKELQ